MADINIHGFNVRLPERTRTSYFLKMYRLNVLCRNIRINILFSFWTQTKVRLLYYVFKSLPLNEIFEIILAKTVLGKKKIDKEYEIMKSTIILKQE